MADLEVEFESAENSKFDAYCSEITNKKDVMDKCWKTYKKWVVQAEKLCKQDKCTFAAFLARIMQLLATKHTHMREAMHCLI